MLRYQNHCLGVLVAVALGACASMSVEECVVADWKHVGTQDGSNGLDRNQLARHYKACGKANIVPDQSQYLLGYQQGLKLYCQPQTVFTKAMNGQGNVNVCPVNVQNQLRPYYQLPRDYLSAKDEVERLLNDLSRVERRLSDSKLSKEDYAKYRSEARQTRFRLQEAQMQLNQRQAALELFQYQNQLY